MLDTTKGIGLCRVGMSYTLGTTRQATLSETRIGLQAKLLEECGEVSKAPFDHSEYADVLQVLMDLSKINGIPWGMVEKTQQDKKLERGGFLDGDLRGLVWTPSGPNGK